MITPDATTRETLRQLITGFRASDLIAAAAELGLADLLADGPRSSAELAERAGADPDALHRVLRALAQLGVFAMLDDGRFALTPLGEPLRSDVPGSLRPLARFWGIDSQRRPWLSLPHTIRTGQTAFDHIYGVSWIEYLAAHPDVAAIFNAGMTGLTAAVTDAVVAAYDFSPFGTIVDVGGGNGTLMAAILAAHPGPRGIVFDLPHARDGALERLSAAGPAARCEFVGGDFFESVPTGADAYLLKWIIHDWDDQRSVAILRACRRAMAPGSKLLIVERLLPPGNEPAPDVVLGDILMLVHTGGRERTAAEYRALLEAADLRLARTVATSTPFSVLEAVPT
ncbi:MAG: methyltransferase, partial [Chloroflexi bacterium]|nr:methyltransferase [Chloroflexota bacterium]